MPDPIVGIDLGTTNTAVALCDSAGQARVLPDDRGTRIQPSVVSFHPNGSVVVGVDAKQRRIIDPRNTVYSVKRLIGRTFRSREIQAALPRMSYQIKEGPNQQPVIVTRAGEFAVPEVSAIVLDHVRSIAKRVLGHEVSRAVVTVPANFNDAQRSATATAGAIAGITVVRVLNEPTAAALAYGHQRQLSKMIAVYDFGGGTFDVTILRLQDQVHEVLATAGDSFLGGDDIDEALMESMADAFLGQHRIDVRENEVGVMRLRAVAEQTKIELSRRTRAIVKVDELAYGPGGAPINLETEITRDQLVTRASPIIERTFNVCDEALRLAGLAPNAIEDVVLVGGSTRIPFVRERVAQFFGRAPRTDLHPEESVALGAALQAAALERILSRRPSSRLSSSSDGPHDEVATSERRTTQPMGASQLRPPGERPGAPGATIDRFEDTGTGPVRFDDFTGPGTGQRFTEPTGSKPLAFENSGTPLARITRPGAATPPPIPPTPRRGPQQRTMIGVPSGPVSDGRDTEPGEVTRDDPFGATAQPTVTFGDGPLGIPNRTAPHDTAPPPPPLPVAAAPASTSPGPPAPPPPQQRATMIAEQAAPPPAMAEPALGPSGAAHQRTMIAEEPPRAPPPPAAPPPAAPTAPPPRAPAAAPPPAPTAAPPAQMPTLMAPSLGALAGAAVAAIDARAGAGAPPAAPAPTPVVLDVTPRGLGIGTVAGYCEELIRRNSRVPTETRRNFTTSRDGQRMVRIRVCQGESRRIEDNLVLGDLVLDGLPVRPRGETTIEVTFTIDASGILQVRARDAQTGQEQRASLDVLGAPSSAEIDAARERFGQLRR